ncbi:DNA-3-methyladenine glycosylase 2 family protein [Frigidibacter sp. MR17.14]|uniref:DNA-3-methyladenine glycosylase family protein n=1 Tax=Frigidibacter sp. MR17.14 TaxID=3126509 RepID=UPI003012D350
MPQDPSARRILGPACLAEGAAWLLRAEPRFAPALAEPLPPRLKPAGFAALLEAIVGQQVSTASAAAITARLVAAGLNDPARAAAATEDELRACGLSRPKVRYVSALARSGLDYAALQDLPVAEAVARLVALPGIGRWTAEIYALSCLGHADAFPAGDLALQEAARVLFELPARPDERSLRARAAAWSPWGSVAARALWVYYRQIRGREGIR